MRKPAVVTNQLWRKMKAEQRRKFLTFYKLFTWELKNLNTNPKATDKTKAHNLAFLASQ